MTTTYRFYRIHTLLGCDEYIGCTKKTLDQRWSGHVNSYRVNRSTCSSQILFQRYGIDCCQISLLEERDYSTLQEARQRERFWLEQSRFPTNRIKPYTSREERDENLRKRYISVRAPVMRELYQQNKEAIKARCLKYYHTNKERVKRRLHREETCPTCSTIVKHYRLKKHVATCRPTH